MIGWLIGFVVSIILVGFLITAPAFTFLFLKIHGRVGWLKTIALAIAVGIVIYGGFDVLMEAGMYKGVLFGDFLSPL